MTYEEKKKTKSTDLLMLLLLLIDNCRFVSHATVIIKYLSLIRTKRNEDDLMHIRIYIKDKQRKSIACA